MDHYTPANHIPNTCQAHSAQPPENEILTRMVRRSLAS
jgi:hypothetical protein